MSSVVLWQDDTAGLSASIFGDRLAFFGAAMKIALIHYHLNRGGVTQVISNHLRALNLRKSDRRLKVGVVYGGRCQGWSPDLTGNLPSLDVSLHAVSELDYDNVRPKRDDLAEQLHGRLQHAGFDPQDTVLHIHNHCLGKNEALPGALRQLAQAGYAMLLHIHDFAEDFRPENYRAAAASRGQAQHNDEAGLLYPQSPHIHYAVLNGRDHSVLLNAGVDQSRLHLLPNAVAEVGPLPPRDEARTKLAGRFGIPVDHRFVLYPVRGIRRKNLGEALLWSLLADEKTSFGLTLAPLNPVEQTSYAQWVQLARQLDLPWMFDVGGKSGLGFQENLSACDLILTTSVAEGFGLAFLESWLAGRSIVGRDLPGITADFVASGIRFVGLSPKLVVPVDWLNAEVFRQQIRTAYKKVLAAYGQPAPSDDSLNLSVEALIQNGLVDFGCCGTALQRSIIERVAGSPADRDRLRALNPWVREALAGIEPTLIARNAEIVRTQYSLAKCGGRLIDLYGNITASDRNHDLQPLADGNRILETFLDLARFCPVRVEQ